jgi:hypothetical protein
MAVRPNFTGAQLIEDEVRVAGASDDDDTDDILDIRVTLVQGDRIESESRVASGSSFPVEDPEGKGGDFRPGPAAVFGVETRRTNAWTTTWAQALTIKD